MENESVAYVRTMAKEVMDFFGYEDWSEFRSDWLVLSEDEKNFFQAEVAKILAATI